MSFFPGKDPAAGDAPACDAIDLVVVPRTRRSRRLRGAPRAAARQAAHGRPVHLLRPYRPGRVPRRPGHRRAAASAYRARHRHLPVRRRDHAPRQPRHRCGDPPRRGQLDDRRPRHRAFRAHRARASRATASRSTACSAGWRCRQPTRRPTPAFAHHGSDELPLIERRGQDRARRRGRALRRALAGADLSDTLFADVTLAAGADAAARRRHRGARASTSSRARSTSPATGSAPGSSWSSAPATASPCGAPVDAARSCCSAARRWTARATSGGTSSPRARSASSRPRPTGSSAGSTACPATNRVHPAAGGANVSS